MPAQTSNSNLLRSIKKTAPEGAAAGLIVIRALYLCERVRLNFTRGDQLAQIAVYERAPCVRAATEAFVLGYETYVCKTDFRFALFFRDLKNNVRIIPLAFVSDKAELAF
jgi:hypothetical protein